MADAKEDDVTIVKEVIYLKTQWRKLVKFLNVLLFVEQDDHCSSEDS